MNQIENRLRELQRVVGETLPLLNAVSQSNSIVSGEPSATTGGLAGILGGILNRGTNQAPADNSGQSNGVLAGILRGVLGTNSTGVTVETSRTLADLTLLRDQLESIRPVLDRLASGLATELTESPDSSRTNSLAPTGRK